MIKTIISAIVCGTVSFAAFAQEAPNPDVSQTILGNNFQIAVMDLVNTATGEVDGERFFYYNGVITEDTSIYIEQAISKYPDVKKIALNSTGGIAEEANELGAIFSDNGIQTWVPKGRFCLSACANAFIGGHNYEIEGILGFHAAWIPEAGIEELTPSQVNALFAHGQYNGVRDTYYWIVNGFSIQLPAHINSLTSPSKFLVFTNTEDLMEYYVRIDYDREAEETQQLIRYLTIDPTITPVVWGAEEMGPYLTEQHEWLSENSTKHGELVEIIYTPAPKEPPAIGPGSEETN